MSIQFIKPEQFPQQFAAIELPPADLTHAMSKMWVPTFLAWVAPVGLEALTPSVFEPASIQWTP